MYQIIIQRTTTGMDIDIEIDLYETYAEAVDASQRTADDIREHEAGIVDFKIEVQEADQLMTLCLDDTDDERDIDEDVRIIHACR